MKIVSIVLLPAILAGCAAPAATTSAAPPPKPPAEPVTPIKLTGAEIETVKTGTRKGLKDPASARFGTMLAGTDKDGSVIVCLLVNAKNSYGGYTGEKPQMGMLIRDKKPNVFVLVPFDERLAEYRDQALLQVCRERGLEIG